MIISASYFSQAIFSESGDLVSLSNWNLTLRTQYPLHQLEMINFPFSPTRVYPTGAVYLKGSVLDSTLQLRATSAYFLTGTTALLLDFSLVCVTCYNSTFSRVFQFLRQPEVQRDEKHRPPPERTDQIGHVHPQLVLRRVLGPGGDRAAVLPLHSWEILWGTIQKKKITAALTPNYTLFLQLELYVIASENPSYTRNLGLAHTALSSGVRMAVWGNTSRGKIMNFSTV